MYKFFSAAKEKIDQENINIVSFDLFDTLLYRPCISGNDLLRMFSEIVKREYNIGVKTLRLSAEKSLGNPYASLREIWQYIALQCGFALELADVLADSEFEFEQKFLRPRQLAKDIFDYAILKGKKVIVVSDTYFSSEQLKGILTRNGFCGISEVYVSCEYRATKRSGALFDIVLANEDVQMPAEILHIGDSRKADVIAAQSKGIKALHFPRNMYLFKEHFTAQELLNSFNDDVYENVIYGFSINHLMENMHRQPDVLSLSTYTHLVVFPMLLHVAIFLLTDPQIQQSNQYKKIYFASRDGFLTKKAYDILSSYFEEYLQSDYLLVSRITSATVTEESFFDRMCASFIPSNCTLKEFIIPTVTNMALRNQILSELSEEELSLLVCHDREHCISLLATYRYALEQHHQEKKDSAYLYYSRAFSDASSILIADCGFSGTISNYLSRAFEWTIKFDKAFFWENRKNKQLDQINGTKTYTAFSQKKGHALGPMVESLFSEVSGSCIGFNCENGENVTPIFEEMWQPEKMKEDIKFIQNLSVELVKEFSYAYGSYLTLFAGSSLRILMNSVLPLFTEKNIEELSMFNNILFKETYLQEMCSESLGHMMLQRNLRGDSKEND